MEKPQNCPNVWYRVLDDKIKYKEELVITSDNRQSIQNIILDETPVCT